jgi:hypothetical protein
MQHAGLRVCGRRAEPPNELLVLQCTATIGLCPAQRNSEHVAVRDCRKQQEQYRAFGHHGQDRKPLAEAPSQLPKCHQGAKGAIAEQAGSACPEHPQLPSVLSMTSTFRSICLAAAEDACTDLRQGSHWTTQAQTAHQQRRRVRMPGACEPWRAQPGRPDRLPASYLPTRWATPANQQGNIKRLEMVKQDHPKDASSAAGCQACQHSPECQPARGSCASHGWPACRI